MCTRLILASDNSLLSPHKLIKFIPVAFCNGHRESATAHSSLDFSHFSSTSFRVQQTNLKHHKKHFADERTSEQQNFIFADHERSMRQVEAHCQVAPSQKNSHGRQSRSSSTFPLGKEGVLKSSWGFHTQIMWSTRNLCGCLSSKRLSPRWISPDLADICN
jgi:hypothetical protein